MTTTAKRAPREAAGGPAERLKEEFGNLIGALGDRALDAAREKLGDTAGRLTDYAEHGGPGLAAAVTGAKDMAEGKSPARAMAGAGMSGLKNKASNLFGGGKGGKGGESTTKVTNIVESIEIGAPISLVYNQWTQFRDFPSFMKKVESVDQEEDEKLHWKAQIFWSHREWDATINQQIPDRRILWHSKGQKGSVDGAVTFHKLAPELTRVVLVLEYHPQGFFEQTANLWRAQGRRARLELKHFRRHVMTQAILHPDEIEGWRGEIQDGEVVSDHESAQDQDEDEDGQRRLRDQDEDEDRERRPRDQDEDEDRERRHHDGHAESRHHDGHAESRHHDGDRESRHHGEDRRSRHRDSPEPEPAGAGRDRARRPAPAARSRRSRH